MKYILVGVRALLLIWLVSILLFILSDGYNPAVRGYDPPVSLMVLDWINLFIHEAGHFFFSPFGFVLKFMGGSIMQLLIPAAACTVWAVRDRLNAHYFLFWLGESAANVSVYIGDAPYRKLPLIGGMHDWHTIFVRLGMLGSAETTASIVYVLGILCMIAAVVAGILAAVYQLRHWEPSPLAD